MGKLVVLRLEGTARQQGFRVNLAIGEEGTRPAVELNGYLPPVPDLFDRLQHHWQQNYRTLGAPYRIKLEKVVYGGSLNKKVQMCNQSAEELRDRMRLWLDSEPFRLLDKRLREELSRDEIIRVLIRTEEAQLKKLPWHLWDFFERYPNAEVALSPMESEAISPTTRARSESNNHVKILAILGHQAGIDIEADLQLLKRLPNVELVFLVEPQRYEINDRLWAKSWDILFFAGHSETQGETGRIYINPTVSLTIGDLYYGLKKTVECGLKLAIFNSCDGLGLAQQLHDLQIPQMILMRELVPDRVAQEFLRHFLAAFAGGQPFYLAVRQARERLQGLEGRFPCATWLPVICQNPTAVPPTWKTLSGETETVAGGDAVAPSDAVVTMVFTDLARSTEIKQYLDGNDITSRNRLYFETVLQPHRQRVERTLAEYGGRAIKTEGDAYFLVFKRAAQAVQWSVALQISHSDRPIPTPFGALQVRIGMHTGSPLCDGDDFIGQEVDYAARIAALANGRQILLSEVTEVFLRQANLSGLKLYPHGDRTLKGIGRVPIFELLYGTQAPQPLRDEIRRKLRGVEFLVGAAIATLTIAFQSSGLLQPLELRAFDQLMRLRPPEAMDSRLLLVEATETDINQYGFPLPDAVLAQAIAALEQHQPRTIGLDIFRDRAIGKGYPQLSHHLQHSDRLILTCSVSETSNPNKPGIPPAPNLPAERLGFSDVVVDPDGILRRHLLFMTPDYSDPCTTDHALSVRVALHYLATENIHPQNLTRKQIQLGQARFHDLDENAGAYHQIDDRGIQVLLNYRAAHPLAHQIKLADVLTGNINPAWIADRLVLIGVTAPTTADRFSTPYTQGTWPHQDQPGLILQAQMVSQILSAALDGRPLLKTWSNSMERLWIFSWALLGSLMVWRYRHPLYWILAIPITLGILTSIGLGLLIQGIWIPLVPAAIVFVATSSSIVAYTRFQRR